MRIDARTQATAGDREDFPCPASEEESHCRPEHRELLLELVRREAQEAVGCTEPATVALAAARAARLAGGRPEAISLCVSPGVMKNGRAVGLPGTERRGLDMAAALGAFAGDPSLDLQILDRISPRGVRSAEALVDAGRVAVDVDLTRTGLAVKAEVRTAERRAEVLIAGGHTDVVSMVLDGRPVDTGDYPRAGEGAPPPSRSRVSLERLTSLSFGELQGAVMTADLGTLCYLVAGAVRNVELAEKAFRGECRQAAAEFVRAMSGPAGDPSSDRAGDFAGGEDEPPGPLDLAARARLWSAAAVSARMGGTSWPVLTSGGSGNQGILVSVPVVLAAREITGRLDPPGDRATAPEGRPGRPHGLGNPPDLARPLLLAHAVNLYLKAFTGEISALCGSVTGGAGVAAAVCWLHGGEAPQIEQAVQLVAAALFGAVCDGAKGSCAVKMGEGAAVGVTMGRLAARGACVEPREGLGGATVEETARLLGRFTREILAPADEFMLGGR